MHTPCAILHPPRIFRARSVGIPLDPVAEGSITDECVRMLLDVSTDIVS